MGNAGLPDEATGVSNDGRSRGTSGTLKWVRGEKWVMWCGLGQDIGHTWSDFRLRVFPCLDLVVTGIHTLALPVLTNHQSPLTPFTVPGPIPPAGNAPSCVSPNRP